MFVNDVTALLCKPSYAIKSGIASQASPIDGAVQFQSHAGSDSEPFTPMGTKNGHIEGISYGAVAMAVHASLSNMFLGTGGKDFALPEMVPTFFPVHDFESQER